MSLTIGFQAQTEIGQDLNTETFNRLTNSKIIAVLLGSISSIFNQCTVCVAPELGLLGYWLSVCLSLLRPVYEVQNRSGGESPEFPWSYC